MVFSLLLDKKQTVLRNLAYRKHKRLRNTELYLLPNSGIRFLAFRLVDDNINCELCHLFLMYMARAQRNTSRNSPE